MPLTSLATIDGHTIHYAPEDRLAFQDGTLADKWQAAYPDVFDETIAV